MRAPAERRSEAEIVADIMKVAKCPPGLKRFVEEFVRRSNVPLPSFTGKQTENLEYAKEVRKHATKLGRLLRNPPSWFLPAALFNEWFWVLWGQQDALIQINPQTRAFLETPRRQKLLVEELDALRAQCDRVAKLKPGKHGHVNPLHEHAAAASLGLLQTTAAYTGVPLRLGRAPTSKFCKVASLFLEAATGEHGVDVTWACRRVHPAAKT